MSWKYLLILLALVPFSFSYSNPSENVGDMAVVKGDVKIKNIKNELSKAKVGSPVNEGDTIIAGKEARAKIAMKDGNIIHISPDTTFTVSKYENDGSQKNVELNLNAGKIRNEVNQKYDGEKNKFLIKTPTAVAGVRGTVFITSHSLASGLTKVITISGKVELSNIPKAPDVPPTTVIVTQGQTAETSAFQPPTPPVVIDKMELKKINDETKSENNGSGADNNPPQQPNAPEKNKETNKKDKKQGTSNEVRVNDKQDQTPSTFEKLPENTRPPVAGTPPPPTFTPPSPPVDSLPANAIRQQNEKTRVIIKPKGP
jgi:hypothetical protein